MDLVQPNTSLHIYFPVINQKYKQIHCCLNAQTTEESFPEDTYVHAHPPSVLCVFRLKMKAPVRVFAKVCVWWIDDLVGDSMRRFLCGLSWDGAKEIVRTDEWRRLA